MCFRQHLLVRFELSHCAIRETMAEPTQVASHHVWIVRAGVSLDRVRLTCMVLPGRLRVGHCTEMSSVPARFPAMSVVRFPNQSTAGVSIMLLCRFRTSGNCQLGPFPDACPAPARCRGPIRDLHPASATKDSQASTPRCSSATSAGSNRVQKLQASRLSFSKSFPPVLEPGSLSE